MAFRVGQKVVCIRNTSYPQRNDVQDAVTGEIYTIRAFAHNDEALLLEEIINGNHDGDGMEWCHCITRFRPIVTRKTDISIFTAMLTPKRQLVGSHD